MAAVRYNNELGVGIDIRPKSLVYVPCVCAYVCVHVCVYLCCTVYMGRLTRSSVCVS